MTPRRILIAGWVLLVLYAHPGYMSYDSVLQLLEARAGEYPGGHPPMMGVLWRLTDAVIPGPLGMLLIQISCFMAGMYVLLSRWMSARAAAVATVALSIAPPISAVLSVIWKDSQMIAFLALGAALLLSPRRNVRLAGLALLWLATSMRYNAFAMTLPLVVLWFEWTPGMRWYRRYPIALVAWLAITLSASFINGRLVTTTEQPHTWHASIALLDLTGTLRYAGDIPEATLRDDLAGVPLRTTDHPQLAARSTYQQHDLDEFTVSTFGTGEYVPALWVTTRTVFSLPRTTEQRDAVSRAWRRIVLGNPLAYLEYRWHVTQERIHLGDSDIPSGTYVWFTDVGAIEQSRESTEHSALPSAVQKQLQAAMLWLGTTWLFRPWLYVAIALLLLPFAFRDRGTLALLLSGLANEALLFVVAPTIDYRYSAWLVVTTLLVLVAVIGHRASGARTEVAPRQ